MFVKPEITMDVLREIVFNAFNGNREVLRIGVVGSCARGNFYHSSDIDLVIDCNDDVSVRNEIAYVKIILEQQFIRTADFIQYADIELGLIETTTRKRV